MNLSNETIINISAALISVIAATSSFLSLKEEKRRIKTETFSKTRVEWISHVRSLLSDFITLYQQGNLVSIEEKKAAYYKISIQMNTKRKAYHEFLKCLSACAEDVDFNDSHLERLVTEFQIMIKEIWERVKLEAGIGSEEDAAIAKKFDSLRIEYRKENLPVTTLGKYDFLKDIKAETGHEHNLNP